MLEISTTRSARWAAHHGGRAPSPAAPTLTATTRAPRATAPTSTPRALASTFMWEYGRQIYDTHPPLTASLPMPHLAALSLARNPPVMCSCLIICFPHAGAHLRLVDDTYVLSDGHDVDARTQTLQRPQVRASGPGQLRGRAPRISVGEKGSPLAETECAGRLGLAHAMSSA